jgi:NAD(P)-dependent dehydrogenase (short-subunit alcohol dehydrogenase family)
VTDVATLVDGALELPVVPSFTKLGYLARRRLFDWTPLDRYALSGRVIAITGATSGIGRAAAAQLARDGATLILVGRDETKNERVAAALRAETDNDAIRAVTADMGDLDAVRGAADAILERDDRLDVLIHNAGALTRDRHVAPDGTEATVAAQVVGPFLLTSLLVDRIAAARPGRVITMSSGGMYTAPLTVDQLQLDEEHYQGARQYALAKRAQVTLNELWAERFPHRDVVFHALHPGWADTPGVVASLPTFHKVMGPLLRDPDQAADTLTWLAADDGKPRERTGEFWLDRRVRPIHRLPTTRRSDTPERRRELWDWVVARSGAAVTAASVSTR